MSELVAQLSDLDAAHPLPLAHWFEPGPAGRPSQHRGDFEVHQYWRAQPFSAQAGTGAVAVPAVIAKGGGQDAGCAS